MDGFDRGELGGMVDHESETSGTESFGDQGEAGDSCWGYGEAVEELGGVRCG